MSYEARTDSLADVIDRRATQSPNAPAFFYEGGAFTWADYARRSDQLADQLLGLALAAGDRVAVLLPDGPDVHVAFVALEKAGLIAVGIGPRAGAAEIRHLLELSGASALVSRDRHRDLDVSERFSAWVREGLPLLHHLVRSDSPTDAGEVEVRSVPGAVAGGTAAGRPIGSRRLGPDDLFLLNSTSGTTGLPKCVCHDQRRWFAFHDFAVRSGRLDANDVFMSVVPAPFGFGLWTAHFTPALLGVPTVLRESFDADATLEAMEEFRVTVLAAVSTQFILLLNSPRLESTRLDSLRVLYTGGEAVRYARALAFEERTGATVLQFYGSNETGALSGTCLEDTRERRLRTAGRVIPEMDVRLFDPSGEDVTATGTGEPGCRGPTLSRGYFRDEEANKALRREDGWMMVNDVVRIDDDGYLSVVGRTGDFIIRGGKNISGPAVEEAVSLHPDVALAAAVAMPDPVFGERVCVYVETRSDAELTLDGLNSELRRLGVSVEMWPERLIVMDALPRGSGGKIAKGQLREDIRRRLGVELE